MIRISLIRLAAISLAFAPLATEASSRSLSPAPKAAGKTTTRPLFPGKPIEPIEAPEKAPAADWSGFYFGVNGGGARSETNR